MRTIEQNIIRAKELQTEALNLSAPQGIDQLPAIIGDLVFLKRLILSGSRLKQLPPEIGQLINLEFLDISDNDLTSLPSEICHLHKLHTLVLTDNLFRELPPVIGSLKELRKLFYLDNPITSPPPEILNRGVAAIKSYLVSLQASKQTKKIFEGKLLIVGQGGVGKTSICNRLLHNTFSDQEDKTDGIVIKRWLLKPPEVNQNEMWVNVWDFGGQEIYHATHQFFLTNRSAYLLVWDARQEDSYGRLDYWFHTIESFGGNSPIILILNKCDEHLADINLKDLKEKFPQICGFYQTSCKSPSHGEHSIEQLKKKISEIMWSLPFMGAEWPESWFNARKEIETLKDNTLSFLKYQAICNAHRISRNDLIIYSQYLHDLGVILHFHGDKYLKEVVILKPAWATNAVYSILDDREVRKRGGILLESDLSRLWRDNPAYPSSIFGSIMRIMANFQLAFPISKFYDSFLVAELLPSNSPDYQWNTEKNIRFFYEFSFLPAGIMPRLIVKLYNYIIQVDPGSYLCWRHGALLYRERKTAFGKDKDSVLLREKNYEKILEINVCGSSPRETLSLIRNELDQIIEGIKKVNVTRKIPCNCSMGCTQLYSYDALIKKERNLVKTINCDVSAKEVSVSSLLYGVDVYDLNNRIREREPLRTLSDNEALELFIKMVATKTKELNLTSEIETELKIEMETISKQLKSPRPKTTILRECGKSIRTILENAGGSTVASLLEHFSRLTF
jgi:small GTP-binding protein